MEIENTQDQEEEIEESGEIGIDDESQEMVDVSMKETAPPAFSEPQPGENLVTRFTTSQLAAVSSRVISDFDADWQSGEGWRKAVAEHLDLYNGVLPDASGGGPNIQPVHFPFVTRAVRIFHSKLFENLYPADRDIVALTSRDMGIQDELRMCSEHMNDQLECGEVKDYRKACDRGMLRFLTEGCVFEIWSYTNQSPRNRFLRADDVVIPYKHEFNCFDMSDFPRISIRDRLYVNELIEQEESGYYVGVTTPVVLADKQPQAPLFKDDEYVDQAGAAVSGASTEAPTPTTEASDKVTGQSPSAGDQEGAREIIEQDRLLRIPGSRKFRAVTVCVDRDTSKVIAIHLREMPDQRDQKRFDREQAEYDARSELIKSQFAERAASQAVAADPNLAEAILSEAMASAESAVASTPPPAPVRMVPWHRVTQYPCFENPGGAYGLGLAHAVAGFNIVANKVATRGLSLMTANLLPTALKARGVNIGNGDVEIAIGRFNEVNLTPDQLERGAGLKILQYPAPDSNWYKIIELMDKSCQEVSAYNIAAGGQGMSGETATEVETRNTNAHDTISMVASRWNAARASSIRNLAYINSFTLPEEGVEISSGQVEGPEGPQIQRRFVTRESYRKILADFRVLFTCDPRVDSQAVRERRAQKMFDVIKQTIDSGAAGLPVVEPAVAQQLARATAANVLKEMRAPNEWISQLTETPIPEIPQQPGQEQPGPAPGAEETEQGPPIPAETEGPVS